MLYFKLSIANFYNFTICSCLNTAFNILPVRFSACKNLFFLNFFALLYGNFIISRNFVNIRTYSFANYRYLDLIFFVADAYSAVDFTERCIGFRGPCLKKFFNTRKALGNVGPLRNTTHMEGAHSELCTRFTDTLCSNNTHRSAEIYGFIGTKITTVTFLANTVLGSAGHNSAHFNFIDLKLF